MPFIPFLISLLDENGNKVESHVILTDKNGKLNTLERGNKVADKVNKLDQHLVDGNKYNGPLNEEASQTNIWFGQTPVTNTRGVALYGNYLIEELQAENNKGQDMLTLNTAVTKELEVARPENVAIDLNIRMESKALDVKSDSNVLSLGEDVEVQDTVQFTHLKTYNEYELVTAAVNVKKDGTTVEIGRSEPLRFTPEKVDNTNTTYVERVNKFTVDSKDVEQGSYVALVDYLYVIKDGKPVLVSTHNDLHNIESQKLLVPELTTNIIDVRTNSRVGSINETQIQDRITYKNFGNKSFYRIVTELVNDNDEVVEDINGNKATQEQVFYVDYRSTDIEQRGNILVGGKDGVINLPAFTVNTEEYIGQNLHIKQTVLDEFTGEVVLTHNYDLDTVEQKLQFMKIDTEAGSGTVQGMIANSKTANVEDKVIYSNLAEDINAKSLLQVIDIETDKVVTEKVSDVQLTAGNGEVKVSHVFDSTSYGNKKLVLFHELYVEHNGEKVIIAEHKSKSAEKQIVQVPEIKTTLYSDVNGNRTKVVKKTGEVTLVDVVRYKNVKVGVPQTFTATLYNKLTKEPVLNADGTKVTGTTTITPTEPNGEVEVKMTFVKTELSSEFDSEDGLVAFEDMNGPDDVLYAFHHDIEDKDQTVTEPKIKTKALSVETESQLLLANELRLVKDIVTVKGFDKGETLTFVAKAHDKVTGQPLLDKDGKEIFGTTTVEWDGNDVQVPFTITADKNFVLYEYVYLGKEINPANLIVTEENKDNDDQSIFVPTAQTKALDKATGTQQVSMKSILTDTIKYKDLLPETEYDIVTRFYDKDTNSILVDKDGKEIVVTTKWTSPKADTRTVSGETTIEVNVPRELIEGKTLVFFERFNLGGKAVIIHENPNDPEQTVYVPSLKTKARDKADNDNIIDGTKTEAIIVDKVFANNLIVGNKYKITGFLVSKRTKEKVLDDNGNVITVTKEFIAKEKNEVHELEFKVNASKYAGDKLVAFESLGHNNEDVAVHHNIEDADQTVNVSLIFDVRIAKADKDKVNYFLSGAEFTVFNADGTIAKDINGKDAVGVTDENGQLTFNVYYDIDNKMYVMETKAPEGYLITDEKFYLEYTDTGILGIDIIQMDIVNEAIVIPPTNDNSNIFNLFSLLGASVLGLFLITRKRKEVE